MIAYNRAVDLAENSAESDLDNIHKLGKGWVAEEMLDISFHCALRYQDDFSAGVIASVNHKGDSDSAGVVTGNILGASQINHISMANSRFIYSR